VRVQEVRGRRASWVEINVLYAKTHQGESTAVLLLEDLNALVVDPEIPWLSWHFLREPELRLRFLTYEPDKVRLRLREFFRNSRRISPGSYRKVWFGCHGVPGKEYDGEADVWGRDWPTAMRMYQATSEAAFAVLHGRLHPPPDLLHPRHLSHKSPRYHAVRYIHLLMNQLGFNWGSEAHLYSDLAFGYLDLYLYGPSKQRGKARKK